IWLGFPSFLALERMVFPSDGPSKTNKSLMSGRTDGGKIVNFKGSPDLLGRYVQVKITNPKQWSLEGELV
ncbi:MAG: TRAM domain-containing protein, partial [Candidatus Ornithomonoglobus sp.]